MFQLACPEAGSAGERKGHCGAGELFGVDSICLKLLESVLSGFFSQHFLEDLEPFWSLLLAISFAQVLPTP